LHNHHITALVNKRTDRKSFIATQIVSRRFNSCYDIST